MLAVADREGISMRTQDNELKVSIGARLRQARKNGGITLQRASEALDVSQQTIVCWEMGRQFPGIENLRGLALLYDISVDYLLGLDKSLPM